MLDGVVPATLRGLAPTEFTLTTRLQNATVVEGERLLPRSDGGRGYVCCGAVQNYILPDVPHTSAATSIETRTRRGMAAREGADIAARFRDAVETSTTSFT